MFQNADLGVVPCEVEDDEGVAYSLNCWSGAN